MKEIFCIATLLTMLWAMPFLGETALGEQMPPVSTPSAEDAALQQKKAKQEATETVERTIEVRRLLSGARISAERAEFDAAITTLQSLISQFPDSPDLVEAYIMLGNLLIYKEKYRSAIDAFRAILEKYPASEYLSTARYSLALAYLAAKDPSSAVTLFSLVPGEEDRKLEIYRKGAEIYFRHADYIEAIDLLLKELPLLSDSEAAAVRSLISRTVRARLAEKDLHEVVRHYRKAFPGDQAQIRLIALYQNQGVYYKAEREIKRFSARFPRHPQRKAVQALLAQMREKVKTNRFIIAVFLPLSGRSNYFGTSALNGIQLALQQYLLDAPEVSVGLVIKDTEEEKNRLPLMFEQTLSEYKPIAVVGPLFSREVEQLAKIVEEKQIPLITPGATAANLTHGRNFLFRNALTTTSQSRGMAQYAMSTLAQRRFVILYPNERYGEELMRAFSLDVLRLGGEVIDTKEYTQSQNDFGLQLRRIIEADLKLYGKKELLEGTKKEYRYYPGFDAFYLIGEAQKVGLIMPQIAFYEIDGVALLGNSGWNSKELPELAGKFADGGIFVDGFFIDSPDPAVREFVLIYRRRYQEDPDLFAAQAYDAAKMILNALKKGAYQPRLVRDSLAVIRDFPGVSGRTTFSLEGEAEKKLFLIEVRGGKFVQIN